MGPGGGGRCVYVCQDVCKDEPQVSSSRGELYNSRATGGVTIDVAQEFDTRRGGLAHEPASGINTVAPGNTTSSNCDDTRRGGLAQEPASGINTVAPGNTTGSNCCVGVEVATPHIEGESDKDILCESLDSSQAFNLQDQDPEPTMYIAIPLNLISSEWAAAEASPSEVVEAAIIEDERDDVLSPGRVASLVEEALEENEHNTSQATYRVACLGGVREMPESSYVTATVEIVGNKPKPGPCIPPMDPSS